MLHKIGNLIFRKNLLIIWMALLTFLSGRIFAAFPSLTEQIYSRGFYLFFASVLSAFSKWFPFSLDDIFYTLLIILLIILIVLVIVKKLQLKVFGILIINSLAACYVLFYWLWGFNYFRENLNTRLNIAEAKPDKTELLAALEEFVDLTNQSYSPVDQTNSSTIDSIIEASYHRHANELRISYPAGTRRPKNITYSNFFAKASISGYFGPFFNEVQVNPYVLPVEYPIVLAHEKAHQFGITSEAEANFYAWLVCSESNDRQVQYSADLYILRYFIYEAARFPEAKEIVQQISQSVRDDYAKIRQHWQSLQNEKIDKMAGKVNDVYLKANKVDKGIEDYSGVLKFVMDYREEKK